MSGAAQALAGKKISFERKVTKAGKLYAAITEKHVKEALKKQLSIDVAEEMIEITDVIKELGTFDVNIKVGENKQEIKVSVKEEK